MHGLLGMKNSLIGLLLCWSFPLFTQVNMETPSLDSLEQQLTLTQDQYIKSNILYQLFEVYERKNFDKALAFLVQSIELTAKAGSDSLYIQRLAKRGQVEVRRGNVEKGEDYLLESMERAQAIDNAECLATIHGYLSYMNYKRGAYENTLTHSLKALEYTKNEQERARIYNNLGSIFEVLKNNDKAASYFKKAVQLHLALGNKRLAGSSSGNLGVVLFNMSKYDSALVRLKESEIIAAMYQDTSLLSIRWQNIGNVFLAQQQYDSAYYYFKHAYQASIITNDTLGITSVGNNLGEVLSAQQKIEEAIAILTQNIEIAEMASLPYEAMSTYESLSEALATKKDFEAALENHKKFKDLNDTLLDARVKQQIHELELKYQTTEKEKQLQARDFELAQKTNQRNTFFVVTVLVLILAAGLTFFLINRIRTNHKLAERDRLLQEQRLKQLQQEQKFVTFKAMIAGEDAERSRLAKDLHDGLGTLLTTLKLSMDKLKSYNEVLSSEHYTSSLFLIDKASKELRRIAHNMMPEALEKFGLLTALEDLCDDVNFHTKLNVTFQHFGVGQKIPHSIQLSLYRIIQELLNNVIKHSMATEVLVQMIQRADILHVTVEDNGSGFQMKAKEKNNGKGKGLQNIRSRVEYLNGTLELESEIDKGTSVEIELVIPKDDKVITSR